MNLPSLPASDSLLDLLRILSRPFDVLEADREAWRASLEKRVLRQRLEKDSDQRKMSDLHKINEYLEFAMGVENAELMTDNTATSSIEALSAKLGQFTKWSLGVKGCMWELENASKVKV